MPAAPRDPEINALDTLIGVLEPLDDEARARVLDYAMRRLGMHEVPPAPQASAPALADGLPEPPAVAARGITTDIRTLRDQKEPATANEMAALVAYYLLELAPEEERKQTITSADLNQFFKQAGYPLPGRIANTLPNAAAAGYFDTTSARGEYKLNPVGFNLVTQTLPRGSGTARPALRKRAAVKTAARKKKPAPKSATRLAAQPKKRATKKTPG